MTQQMSILVLPALLVVAALILHSVRFRGGRDTLWFFLFAALFGIARGNIIWWITTVHFGGKFPYIFQRKLLGVYHDSFTADAGWILCLYLGSYLAIRITDRIAAMRNKVFPIIALACLFNACLSYAVESTAITMGWWQWTLSTESSVLRDVPTTGIWAWFSVGFDFLVPYILIRHVRRPGQWWPYLTVLLFPLHMWMHLSNERASEFLPITPYGIYHWLMLLAVLVLPFISRMELRRPWFREGAVAPRATVPGGTVPGGTVPGGTVPGGTAPGRPAPASHPTRGERIMRSIPFIGLGVVIGVLLFCDLVLHREPGLLIPKVPLALFVLLVVPAIPAWAVLGVAVLGAILGGVYLIVPVLVPLFYLALRGRAYWDRRPWLRWVYLLVPLALTAWHVAWSQDKDRLDRRYGALVAEGVALASTDPDAAVLRLREAAELKPHSMPAYENLLIVHSKMEAFDEAEAVLRTMLEMRPINEEIRANFGTLYIMKGDYEGAEAWFREALSINPDHEYSRRAIEHLQEQRRAPSTPASP